MMPTIWLPLNGPNDKGQSPKGCNIIGWNEPGYAGVDPNTHDGWVGIRLDDLIVVDCDDEQAYQDWLAHIGLGHDHTMVRKTPHGYHLFYARGYDGYTVQSRKLAMISPKLELKTGVGHEVVFYAPGYFSLNEISPLPNFDTSWLPPAEQRQEVPDWSQMPEGIGDNAMTSFAGTFRRWGMDEATIRTVLHRINEVTMVDDPMPPKTIRRIARQAGKWDPDEPETVECPKCGATWTTL